MFRTALRNLVAHKLRLFTTGLAVTLGVAFMSGTLIFTDTIGKTFDDLFADIYEGTDAVVRAEAAFETPNGFGDQRGRVEESLIDLVAGVDGVAEAQGDVYGYAQIVDKTGDPMGDPEFGAPTLGGNWYDSQALNTWTLVAGREPRADDEVVIDKLSADEAGYRVGDTVPVLVKGGPQSLHLTGIVTFGDADSPGGASFALFTTPVAQRFVGEPGKYDAIVVLAEEGISQSEITSRIEAALPEGTEAITGEEITAETQDAVEEGLSFFNTFMLIFAVVALLVGGFIIFNTFFITVAQRTRENALMRALGASKRQLLASVLLEALGIGIIASVIGVALGLAVASGLKGLLSGFGFEMPAGRIVFTPSTAVTSLLAGVVITVLAAVSPARKAGKVPPVAAMRDVAVGSTGYGSKERIIVGSGILAGGLVALLFGLFGDSGNALPLVGLGVLLVFFGVSALGRTVALPLSRVIGLPLPRLRGVTGQLARENAMRNPKRTAATASALMIGVGLVGFITIFASSAKASFNQTIDKALLGDFVLTSPAGFAFGGIDPALTERIAELPEIEAAAGLRAGFADINGDAQSVLASGPSGFEIVDVEPLEGTPEDLNEAGTIAVFEDVAEEEMLSLGDLVPVTFKDTGPQLLRVAMIYGENQPAGDWFLGLTTYEENFGDQYDFQVFVKKAEGVGAPAALAAVEHEAAAFPGVKVLDQSQYKEDQTAFVDQLLGLVYALLGLAIVIALLGIGNTLALSILERTRELGVLRAVGMTRSQLRSTIRWESVIIALQGALLGLVIGVFFGWALVEALATEGLNTFDIPVTSIASVVVLAALAGVVAAVWPARRAAKLNVLRAVVTE